MSFDMKRNVPEGPAESPFLNEHEDPIDDPEPRIPSHFPPAAEHVGKVLARWETFEHEPGTIGSKSYIPIAIAFIAIVGYALFTDSLLMAIVFILIGMVGYLLMNRPTEIVEYSITEKGVSAGKEFYGFEDIRSFWILEGHPDFPKQLIIQTDGWLVSHVHIPLADQYPEAVRQFLAPHIPEEKYEPGLIDTIEKMFHI